MKKILILEMGGTISAKGMNRLDYKDYTSGIFHGDDFLRQIPELTDVAHVTFEAFSHVSSTKITPANWVTLRNTIIERLENRGYDGIVISHGTSTLEETAYFLHLTVPTTKPIVCVGAQRPLTALSTDASLNLLQAVRVAASDEAREKGVLVVLNDAINSARDVTKAGTYRVETFQSGPHGNLGVVDVDQTVQFYRQPTRKHTHHSVFATLEFSEKLANVEIVYSYAGASGFLIDQITKSGNYAGIVVCGTGAGLMTPEEIEASVRASESGLFVVRSSRVGSGRVVPIQAYEKYPFIHGDDLLPQKARILLMVSLAKYNDITSIQRIFDTY